MNRISLALVVTLIASSTPALADGVSPAIVSTGAPAAIGPYSQGTSVGSIVFCSGQLGLDPTTGTLVATGVEDETRRAMANLAAVLGAAGLGMKDVVKTTIYVTDLADFAKVNAVYGESFKGLVPPARATVGVAALPKGGHIEIEAIAIRR